MTNGTSKRGDDRMTNVWRPSEPIAKLGDIIEIRGYGRRRFEVYSVSYTMDLDALEVFEDIFYDVVSTDGTEYIMTAQEDIAVVETPSEVDYERLESHLTGAEERMFEDYGLMLGGIGFNIPETKTEVVDLRNSEKDKAEEDAVKEAIIDDLLTELNAYYTIERYIGEDFEEGDGKYRNKIDEIKAELTELTKEWVERDH